MFKNLKALKIPSRKKHEEKEKEKDNSHTKKHKWTKPKGIPGFKKLKETMGNLTPSMFHGQHYIVNADEHATRVMAELERMRQNGTLCDVTVRNCDGGTSHAHKIVVSFNEKLLEMTMQTPEETETQISSDVTYGMSNGGYNGDKSTEPKDEAAAPIILQDELEQAAEEGSKKEAEVTGTDETKSDPPADEEKSVEQGEEVTTPQTDDVTEEKDDVSEVKDDVTHGSDDENTDKNEKEESSQKDGGDAETEAASSNDVTTSSDVTTTDQTENTNEDSPIEMNNETDGAIGGDPDVTIPESCDVTIEEEPIIMPVSLEDPLEVLIHFFYTSHINITQKNVVKLRIVANQCGIHDVSMACDEFENVLETETESMETTEEKDAAASQFRYQYSDPQMPVKMLEHFEKLRHQSRHIDVNMTSSNPSHKYPGHLVLLLAATDYFKDLINSDVIRDSENDVTKQLNVTDISDAILQLMMTYIYTAKVPVSSQNVQDLMQAAKMMNFSDVVEGSAEYLEGTVSTQNCIEIQRLAEQYECTKLQKMSSKFIDSNFFAVSKTNDFLSLSKDKLLEIISSDTIISDFPASDAEYHIYEAVRKWLNHDLDSRKKDVHEVMSGVRFPLISERNLLDHISTDLLVMTNDALCGRVSGIMAGKSSASFSEEVTMRGEDFILMVGGSVPVVDETSDEQGYTAVAFNDYVTLYNVPTGKTHSLTHLPESRSLHCALTVDHYVIIAGGFDKYSCITNEVYCLDLSDVTWTNMPKMKTKRACFAMFSLNGYFYAAGGLTPTGYSNKVERYHRKKKKWEAVSHLPKTYYRHAGCEYKGELIMSGGNEKIRDVLKYDPSCDKWMMMKPLNFGRDSHVMIKAHDKLYVIGGDADNLPIEVYDSATEHWEVLTGILNIYGDRLYIPGAAAFGDKIYLFGGWRGDDDACDEIRRFNAATERWETCTTCLPFPRASMTASKVRLPRNYFGKNVPCSLKES